MTRPSDATIPDAEELYRGLRAEHVMGGTVLPDAIDMQGTSVTRSSFAEPAAALSANRNETRIGVITPGELPPPMTLDLIAWEWFAADAPEEGNEPHAELRVRRIQDRPNTANQRTKGTKKEQLRHALARAFRILSE